MAAKPTKDMQIGIYWDPVEQPPEEMARAGIQGSLNLPAKHS